MQARLPSTTYISLDGLNENSPALAMRVVTLVVPPVAAQVELGTLGQPLDIQGAAALACVYLLVVGEHAALANVDLRWATVFVI